MKTKLWHIGIASAIMATMGLAHAQTSPGAESPGSPPSLEAPVGASGSVPGIPADAASPSSASDNMNSPNWNSQQGVDQAPPADTSANAAPAKDPSTQGTFLGVGERGLQSANNNDGLNMPSGFVTGDSRNSDH